MPNIKEKIKLNNFLILALIVFLAGFLRFYQLGKVPAGFHRDEAFLGYNAYSILKTGRDINGNFFPLHLQSFLYSPAGYGYFSIPSIALFGLNAFAVRFPSAFFGSLTVLLVYYLVNELFINELKKENKLLNSLTRNKLIALTASFLLAISPWHINLCRTSTENVIVVFFITLGALFWFCWLKEKKLSRLIASFAFFGITLTLYQGPRAFLPLFIPVLFLISFLNSKISRRNQASVWLLFFVITILPLLFILFSKNLSLRIRTVSIFSSQQTQLVIDQQIREDGVSSVPIFLTRLFHNKPTGYLAQFLENYFAHFSFNFLFTEKGLPERYRVPLSGLLYLFELPLLLFGSWFLLKKRKKESLILFSWLLLVPVGSALTFDDVPNLQRTLIIFPALSIILAFGLLSIMHWLSKKRFSIFLTLPIILFAFYNFFFYLHQYYVHFPLYQPWHRNDGYENLVKEVNRLLPNYKKAVITNYESAPTIFFLFFSQYDPVAFQKETKNPTLKDFDRIDFGKYEFSEEQCPLRLVSDKTGRQWVNGKPGILYVNSGLCKMPIKNANELLQIRRGDNSLVFRILEYRK